MPGKLKLLADPAIELAMREAYSGSGKNEINEVQCSSWEEFIVNVRRNSRAHLHVFRGQQNPEWTLQSKWERYNEQKGKLEKGSTYIAGMNETKESLLERFRMHFTETGNLQFNNDETLLMTLARHHGLITPLLDWTRSPYVAAFFAYESLVPKKLNLDILDPLIPIKYEGDVSVFEFAITPYLDSLKELEIVFKGGEASYRQRAQSGLFTKLDSEEHTNLNSYLKENNRLHILTKYNIPKNEVLFAMHDLHLMNINYSTIYPDADGAAKQANMGNYIGLASKYEEKRRILKKE